MKPRKPRTLEKEAVPVRRADQLWDRPSAVYLKGLNMSFCKRHRPSRDSEVTLTDKDDEKYPTVYLPRKTGLSGGWQGFAVAHDLADGDALAKVYITRASGFKKTAAA